MSRGLRVIGGAYGSLRLQGPPAGVRPTTERAREVLFSSLGEAVVGRPFVDLYAGSGAVGIEALSRGASRCLFVEQSPACLAVIRANLACAEASEAATVWRADVRRAFERIAAWLDGEAGVVFADPPYSDDGTGAVLAALVALGVLPDGSLVVLECSSRRRPAGLPPPNWERAAGETALLRWELTGEGTADG